MSGLRRSRFAGIPTSADVSSFGMGLSPSIFPRLPGTRPTRIAIRFIVCSRLARSGGIDERVCSIVYFAWLSASWSLRPESYCDWSSPSVESWSARLLSATWRRLWSVRSDR